MDVGHKWTEKRREGEWERGKHMVSRVQFTTQLQGQPGLLATESIVGGARRNQSIKVQSLPGICVDEGCANGVPRGAATPSRLCGARSHIHEVGKIELLVRSAHVGKHASTEGGSHAR